MKTPLYGLSVDCSAVYQVFGSSHRVRLPHVTLAPYQISLVPYQESARILYRVLKSMTMESNGAELLASVTEHTQ